MTNKYDLDHVKKHLPHRDPFLFVDKVIDIELGKRIHAQRFLSPHENFYAGHIPD